MALVKKKKTVTALPQRKITGKDQQDGSFNGSLNSDMYHKWITPVPKAWAVRGSGGMLPQIKLMSWSSETPFLEDKSNSLYNIHYQLSFLCWDLFCMSSRTTYYSILFYILCSFLSHIGRDLGFSSKIGRIPPRSGWLDSLRSRNRSSGYKYSCGSCFLFLMSNVPCFHKEGGRGFLFNAFCCMTYC